MTVSNISRVKSIVLNIPMLNNSIITVYSNDSLSVGDELMPNYTVISFSCFIKNLRVFASVPSLEEAPFPDYALTDSATAKLVKTLDIEWKSPRKQLNLFITNTINPTNEDWLQVGSVSLLNPYGYPFRVYNILDLFTDNLALELGENGKIGIQAQDVGYGLIANTDKVTVHGSYIEEIFVQSPQLPDVFNINISGITTSPTQPADYLINNTGLVDNTFLLTN